MKKILSSILLVIIFAIPQLSYAQVLTTNDELELYTEIQSPAFTEMNSPMIFNARPQFNTEEFEEITFNWDFGDGDQDEGKEVAHSFKEPGNYTVSLTTKADELEATETKEVFVAIKAAAFISDQQKHIKKIDTFLNYAENSNVYLRLVESFTSQSEFLSEEVIARKLLKQEELISKLDVIVVWTQGSSGLNALTRFKQNIGNKNLFSNTSIILIEEDLDKLRRVNRQFNQLKPKEIIVIQEPGFFQYIETPEISEFKAALSDKKVYNYEIIDQQNITVSRLNILSYFLDFLTEKGIPDNTIILILLLPVIATVIAFMKQVIGITTLGIYTPTIITLTFLTLGLEFGVLLLFSVILMGSFAHKLIKPLKLLYIPKMALVLTSVSIILFLLLTLTVYLDLFDIEFISLAIFPVVIMGTLTEKFVTLRSEKGISGSLLIMIETFFVSLTAYFATGGVIDLYFFEIQWTFLRNLLLNTPEVIVLFILINIYLGRWTGLQLTEYINYRDIINSSEE
jgi:PKD repeat protein